nr:MAG TPA: hypothetical protein [Caudoviricetes sp.]
MATKDLVEISIVGKVAEKGADLQRKIITPTKETQVVTADEGYYGLSEVIVSPPTIDGEEIIQKVNEISETLSESYVGGDAKASEILEGKTAYVKGTKITGVIPKNRNTDIVLDGDVRNITINTKGTYNQEDINVHINKVFEYEIDKREDDIPDNPDGINPFEYLKTMFNNMTFDDKKGYTTVMLVFTKENVEKYNLIEKGQFRYTNVSSAKFYGDDKLYQINSSNYKVKEIKYTFEYFKIDNDMYTNREYTYILLKGYMGVSMMNNYYVFSYDAFLSFKANPYDYTNSEKILTANISIESYYSYLIVKDSINEDINHVYSSTPIDKKIRMSSPLLFPKTLLNTNITEFGWASIDYQFLFYCYPSTLAKLYKYDKQDRSIISDKSALSFHTIGDSNNYHYCVPSLMDIGIEKIKGHFATEQKTNDSEKAYSFLPSCNFEPDNLNQYYVANKIIFTKKVSSIVNISVRDYTNFNNYIRYYDCIELKIKNITSSLTLYGSKLTNIIVDCFYSNTNTGGIGTRLSRDSLLFNIQQCMESSTQYTLTIGSYNLSKLDGIYVKLVDVTADMIKEDENIVSKMPFTQCESTDEGAMTIDEYVALKKWKIA